jgi:DNA invertase Pin-like site-specific DNA recombinase
MRVGVYLRVSTNDKGQTVETQRLPLAEFCAASHHTIVGEWSDEASATNLKARTGWRAMLEAASKRKFDLLLVHRLDRAFRSVPEAASTLERLRGWGIGFRSLQESWIDTTSPFGEALYYITAAYASLERGILRERVRAGMDRAKRQGVHVGRPHALNGNLDALLPAIAAGTLSRRAAAKRLGVAVSTVSRAMLQKGGPIDEAETRTAAGSVNV